MEEREREREREREKMKQLSEKESSDHGGDRRESAKFGKGDLTCWTDIIKWKIKWVSLDGDFKLVIQREREREWWKESEKERIGRREREREREKIKLYISLSTCQKSIMWQVQYSWITAHSYCLIMHQLWLFHPTLSAFIRLILTSWGVTPIEYYWTFCRGGLQQNAISFRNSLLHCRG